MWIYDVVKFDLQKNILSSSLLFNVRTYLQKSCNMSYRFTSTQKKRKSEWYQQQCIIFVIDVSLHIVRVFVWFYRDFFSYRNTFTPHTFRLNGFFIQKKKMKNEKIQEKMVNFKRRKEVSEDRWDQNNKCTRG